MHVQNCCFANLNLLLLWRSRRRRRRRILRSLTTTTAAATSKASGDLHSLLFSSSIKKTKGSSAHRVASILTWPGRPTIRSLVHRKATRNMPFHGIEILKPVVLLTRIKIHHHITFCGWPPVSALTEKKHISHLFMHQA